jgi:hypothetical protein
MDKDFKILGVDMCREYTCDTIHDLIKKGKLPGYIGICLEEEVDLILDIPNNETFSSLKKKIKSGEIKIPGIKAAEKKLVSRAHKMSKRITALEKKFKFKTHSLRCLTPNKGILNPADIWKENWGHNAGKLIATVEVQHIWAFKLDAQWLSSVPTTSYALLCMREFSSDLPDKNLESNNMFKLLSKKKPVHIFGRSRKVNWGIGRYTRCSDTTYGMDSFQRDYMARASVRLREIFPDNNIFKK